LSYVANPGPGGTINGNEIVLKDLTTGALTRVLTAADDGRYANIEFSPDGASLMFASAASNLVPNDTNRSPDVFIKNLATGAISLVSAAADGTQGNGGSYNPHFSADGKKIAFGSASS